METIKLDLQQKNKATDVLVAAFFNYPMFDLYFPDLTKRKKVMTWYLGKVMNCALRYGEVYTTRDLSGVVFTLPPGHTKISQWEYIQQGFLPAPFFLGLPDFIRSQLCEAFVSNEHEKLMKNRAHYYLWGLVVDPSRKKQGIGAALLTQVIEKADAENMPIYLETHDENNVAYYQKMGFQLIRTARILNFEVPIWCMIREPN